MALVDRAKNMILTPASEWPVLAMEPATLGSIYSGYVIPLAAIGPVCAFVSQALFLHHIVLAVVMALLTFVLELVAIFVVALIADALAPSFDGAKNQIQALKWVAYSGTPRMVAGVFQLIPVLGSFLVLIASLYGLYVLYLGTVPVMRIPQTKAVGYTVVVIVCYIVLIAVVSIGIGAVVTAMTFGAMMQSGAYNR